MPGGTGSVNELARKGLHPPVDGHVIDLDATFGQPPSFSRPKAAHGNSARASSLLRLIGETHLWLPTSERRLAGGGETVRPGDPRAASVSEVILDADARGVSVRA
jgi:hypothetical protein